MAGETDAAAVVVEVKEAMEKLAVDENFENKDPKPETELSAAAKKKNKKKKKAAATEEKTTVEDKEDCKEGAEQKEALATVDENKDSAEQVGCAHCKKAGPSKRCSKRHPKCLKKMFCNETCEALAHADPKKAAAKKAEAGKAAAAKKAGNVKNWKNTDSGQFWWHDQ